jgi:subtilase family serine protease
MKRGQLLVALVTATLLMAGTAQLVAAAPPDSFTASPTSVSITAKVGETKTADVTITAKKPVVLQEPAITGDSHFSDTLGGTCWQAYLSLGQRIPGKVTCTIRVGFTPTGVGTVSSTLRVAQCTVWHAATSGALVCDVTSGFQSIALTGTVAAQPDLTLRNVTAGSTGTAPFTWAARVSNDGAATVNVKNVAIAAFYSSDATAGGDTAACGGVVSSAKLLLAPGQWHDVAFACSALPPAGTTHLVVRVDGPNAVAEADETNNTTIIELGSADLVIDSIALEQPDISYAHSWTAVIDNIGDRSVDLSQVIVQGFYSADTIVDGLDAGACGTTATGTLAPNATAAVLVSCSAAPGVEHVYLIAVVDIGEQVAESNEANNQAALLLPGSDLHVQDVVLAPRVTPAALIYGVRVENLGPEPVDIAPTAVRGWFSVDNVIDASDLSAGWWTDFPSPVVLAFGQSTTVSLGAELPSAAYKYLIVEVDADHVLAERDESNNVFVLALKPDLVVGSVEVLGSDASNRFNYQATIVNMGGAPFVASDAQSLLTVGAWISDDGVLDATDSRPAFCSPLIPSDTVLAPGASMTIADGCALNPDWGADHLIVVVDESNVLDEGDETNNVNGVLLPNVDLQVSDVVIDNLQPPGSYAYDVTIKLDSSVPINVSGNLIGAFYSVDQTFGNGDNPACPVNVPLATILGPGGTIVVHAACNETPAATDNWLLVMTDFGGDIHESDETNNLFARSTIVAF